MIIHADLEIGPRNFPVVASFQVFFCGKPGCGPHLILKDRNGDAFMEMVMSVEQICEVEGQTMTQEALRSSLK